MAINMHRSFINNTGFNENKCLNILLDNVSPEFENECDIISHSTYCTDVDFQEILQEANCDMCIVNLNCLNLKSRFDQLQLFLADTDRLSRISCITLQGTCYDENTDLAFYLRPGYTLISDAYRISSHCGIAIYLNNDFSHERTFINSTPTVFESVTSKIWKNDTIASKYLRSSVYRPPTALVDALRRFIDEFTGYLDDVQKIYRKVFICGDININL